jgi:transcriptional regulator of aroF, aroG, tyrA and aromatic amino acid transport
MQSNLKLNLLFEDRVGIVADISTLVAEKGLNIVLMEVVIKDGHADIYLEVENGKSMPSRKEIFETLGMLPDLLQIRFIETLPREMRENRIQVVLDNIGDGVISIDAKGKIRTINKVACRVLDYENDEIIGKDIKELDLPDFDILECLKGKTFTNVKKNLITEKARFQYFATDRPITDSSGRIVGAVEIGKDMQEIKMLAQSISQPNHITFNDFIGENPVIKEAISFAQRIAETDSIVFIRGESGTGKELLARAIHAASSRKGSFVPINCANLPEPLLESELFGYVGGAFTGARKTGKLGLFEIAAQGTVFLDEIGEMPLSVQAKILRVIQEKYFRRIGGVKELPVNARIITATNKNLEQMLIKKLFREDLYYRINVLPIHIIPLRERSDDIPVLIDHFLFQLDSKLNKKAQFLSKGALKKLLGYSWPGNVRELKNVIERAAILCDNNKIETDQILLSSEISKKSNQIRSRAPSDRREEKLLHHLLNQYEKQIITETLETSESIRKAAKELGISHTTLLNKIKKHRLSGNRADSRQ